MESEEIIKVSLAERLPKASIQGRIESQNVFVHHKPPYDSFPATSTLSLKLSLSKK